jgi:hypothetical protein
MRATVSKTHHRMGWSPESRVGKWTLALAGLGLGGTVVLGVAFSLGLEPADSFTDNWLLTGSGAAILASAAASVVTGGLALIRRHDHSWMVLSATGIGVLVTALMLQQVGEGLGLLGS